MTTTGTYSGISEDGKPSSRVLAPPGGGTSNIFNIGGDAPQPQRSGKAMHGNSRNQSTLVMGDDSSPQPEANTPTRQGRQDDKSAHTLFGQPDAKPAPPPQEGLNPITGQANNPNQRKPVHTSISVKQPPGGASSGPLW